MIAALLYFDCAFMVWVLLGPLAPAIVEALALSPAQAGLMVAVPTLSGAMLRVPAGILADRIGARRTGAIGQTAVIVALGTAWAVGIDSFAALLLLGMALGIAGASFAVALPLVSRWYPPRHQGKVLGIAGMGNSGTVLAALTAPELAMLYGWRAVLGLAVIPLAAVLCLYLLLAREPPERGPRAAASDYLRLLRDADAWALMGFYAVTFGGFSGLAASLGLMLTQGFGMSIVMAGFVTAACVFAGSLARPLGGALADRLGGATALAIALSGAAANMGAAAVVGDRTAALPLFLIAMAMLGIGNGAVFQLVPQRFGARMGSITGLVGMAGGVGGFALSLSLGLARQWSGSFMPGLSGFALLAGCAIIALGAAAARWRTQWPGDARI